MNTAFLALALFTHDLDNGSAERVVMIRKSDVSAVYESQCSTFREKRSIFGSDYTRNYVPCVRVLLNNKEEFEVQGNAIDIMANLRDRK